MEQLLFCVNCEEIVYFLLEIFRILEKIYNKRYTGSQRRDALWKEGKPREPVFCGWYL